MKKIKSKNIYGNCKISDHDKKICIKICKNIGIEPTEKNIRAAYMNDFI